MAKLIYSMLTSLDGYVADKDGHFRWAAPDEEVHAFITNLERNTSTFLLGRRMYEVLAVWETMPEDGPSSASNEYGKIWRTANKIVYSTSLIKPATKRTVIKPEFDVEAIRRLKSQSKQNLVIGGPQLAAEAIRAGLVDEFHQFIAPMVVGGGNYWLPQDIKIKLELGGVQKFEKGFVHLHYNASD